MDPRRLDTIAKLFADRRLSRRKALAQGGAALAATGLAVTEIASTRTVNAQEATPAVDASAGSDALEMLYVQAYQAGSIAPKEGVDGRYTLTLEAGAGQTIYFSDRPDRVVGAWPTDVFLDTLGFPDDNPPNAALLVETAPGETDVAVIELFSPVYDEATQGITYDIAVLQNWAAELDMEFHEAPTDLAVLEPSFGSAHLFIDGLFDCPDHDLVCSTDPYDPTRGGGQPNGSVGTISNAEHDGFCVQCPQLWCAPCQGPAGGGSWSDECNRRFADQCNGQCRAWPSSFNALDGWT